MPGARFRPRIPRAAAPSAQNLESVFIDTGENGIFSLEEFSAITTGEQMEFVTPEEIADVVARELQGGNTGHDVINALDNAVMGPTYRAGLMRHWALEKLRALEKEHERRAAWPSRTWGRRACRSCSSRPTSCGAAFDDHGRGAGRAPRPSCRAARPGPPDRGRRAGAARSSPSASPSSCPTGACCAGPSARSRPCRAPDETHEVTAERDRGLGPRGLGGPARGEHGRAGRTRFERIEAEIAAIPATDTSSRFLRDRQFWGAEGVIQPGKVVGWIFATEDKGARMK